MKSYIYLLLLFAQASYQQLFIEDDVYYDENSVLEEIKGTSYIQCSLRCKRKQACKHVAYDKQKRSCTLLSEVLPASADDDVDASEENTLEQIFTQVIPPGQLLVLLGGLLRGGVLLGGLGLLGGGRLLGGGGLLGRGSS